MFNLLWKGQRKTSKNKERERENRLGRYEEVGKNDKVYLRTNLGNVLGVHFEKERERPEEVMLGREGPWGIDSQG